MRSYHDHVYNVSLFLENDRNVSLRPLNAEYTSKYSPISDTGLEANWTQIMRGLVLSLGSV